VLLLNNGFEEIFQRRVILLPIVQHMHRNRYDIINCSKINMNAVK